MSSRRPVRQLLVAVLLGVLVGGGLLAVTPAGAEVSQAAATSWKKIWKKELKPLAAKAFYTKKQSDATFATKAESAAGDAAANAATDAKLGSYYKKTESDAKYAGAGSSYTKAESDQKYVAKPALITGSWGIGSAPTNGYPIGTITFGAVLSAAPTTHFIDAGAVAPPQCPGTADAPNAQAGHLCVWAQQNSNISGPYLFGVRADSALVTGSATSNSGYAWGTWAVRPAGYAAPLTIAKSSPVPSGGSGPGR